jgi:hypothetical protein
MKPLATFALALVLGGSGCGGSVSPTPVPCPTVSPVASVGALLEPGVARLAGGHGCVADGVRGSWRLDHTHTESPWVPASALEPMLLSTDDLVLVGWADGTPIGEWTAQIGPATDTSGAGAVNAGSGDAGGADFFTFGRVSPGDWVLAVTLHRADGRGEATYYWALRVSGSAAP